MSSLISENVDISIVAETKLDSSFPTTQFVIPGFHHPFRLDINRRSGGLLVYVKGSIPARVLTSFSTPADTQTIVFEINLRKEKWLFVAIYKPPSLNSQYFLDTLSDLLDFYSNHYDNKVILGDFNLKPTDPLIMTFLNEHDLINLIKNSTCFKGEGSCIDLILINQKFSFKNSTSFEKGLSDHHHLIYSMLKTTFHKEEPKTLIYRDYKTFSQEKFSSELILKLESQENNDYQTFETNFVDTLNNHKTKSVEDLIKNKKQRNLVVKLNKNCKKEFFNNLETKENSKSFWNKCKPYFSNKHSKGDSDILLIEKDELLLKNKKVADVFNSYFQSITDSLDLFEWPLGSKDQIYDSIDRIIDSFQFHPSIKNIKRNYKITSKFSFKPVSEEFVKDIVNNLSSNKAAGGEIPVKILKECDFSFHFLTKIKNKKFPDSLKLSNIVPVHKKKDATDKTNYRPVSILPLLSKVFEKVMYIQLYDYMENFLNQLLCGFRKAHSTQHALFRLIQSWHKELDESGFVGTILMDLSKAYDCLPHDLMVAKLEAYGISKEILQLISDYLSYRKQRTKNGSAYSDWANVICGIPQGSILGPLLFNIFINDIFLVVEKSDICNFADDNTLYSHGSNLPLILNNLEHDLKNLLYWFKINSLKAKPGKLQFMILGNNKRLKYCLKIRSITIKESDEVELLGITIDKALNFKKHIENLCRNAQYKLHALRRIRKYLTLDKAKLLGNAFIDSQFNYAPLIWMLCHKGTYLKMQKIHHKFLKVIYQFDASYDDLQQLSNSVSLHQRHLRFLLTEIYKSTGTLNPQFMWSYFKYRKVPYNLRRGPVLFIPPARSAIHGTNSVHFLGSLIWNRLPHFVKSSRSLSEFKNVIKKIGNIDCRCMICRR